MTPTRFVIIGGGPGGNTAATYAARHGAEVVMIEKDVVGGAAHLWDCIPSKAMIATGGAMSFLARAEGMGLGDVSPRIDVDNLATRLATIEQRLHRSTTSLLESQNVRLIEGTGSLKGPHQVVADTAVGLEEIVVTDCHVVELEHSLDLPAGRLGEGDGQAFGIEWNDGHTVAVGVDWYDYGVGHTGGGHGRFRPTAPPARPGGLPIAGTGWPPRRRPAGGPSCRTAAPRSVRPNPGAAPCRADATP